MLATGDKAKETKEREERDAQNQKHAGYSYHTPDARDMGTDDELSGLPWGSLSLRHVVSTGKAREDSSRRGSRRDEDRSNSYESQNASYSGGDAYYEADAPGYDESDQVYYDYGSGRSSR